MSSASCVAVIPARGGSKGLPRKNVRVLGGKPLIAHNIEALLAASRVTSVWVSTDDPEIAEVARRFGAGVIERPVELAGDTATSESALTHALGALRDAGEPEAELVMMVQCTSPLTQPADFDGLVATLERAGADSAFTAAPFHHFLWDVDEDGHARGLNHQGKLRKRRQDLRPQYLENGAAYLMRRETFLATGERFCGDVVIHVMDEARTLEIDSASDFERAETVVRRVQQEHRAAALPRGVRALVMDFDGVFTDNRVLVDQDGREAVFCDRGDGMGLGLLADTGVSLLILSKERNPVVARRAEKLGIECMHAVDDKPAALSSWLRDQGLQPKEAVFIGNDVNDIGCMAMVGCSAAPSDAHESALRAASIVLRSAGGRGALRELCDLLVAARTDPPRVP